MTARRRTLHPVARHARRPRRLLRLVRARWPLALAAVLAVLGTALTAPLGVSQATPAGAPLKPGAGMWVDGHTTFVGYYRALVSGRWVKVYCVSPDRRTPSRIGLSTVSRLSAGTTVTRELAETLFAHGNSATAVQAAAVSQALNYEIGNRAAVASRGRHLGRTVQALAMRYVAEARRSSGPYQLALHLAAAPLPGQLGRATVTLRAPGGGRSATVRLTHSSNVSVPATVRTDASGRATFTYRTTGAGQVRLRAHTTGLAPSTLRASVASRSVQRMLSWSAPVSVQAFASYRGQVAGFSQRYECSSTCDGSPLATLTACAAGNGYPSAITYRHAADAIRVDFPAAPTRTCRSIQTRLHDRETVTAAWQFHTPRGWTGPLPAPGSFRVDCPPAPPVAIAVSYDCHSAAVTAVLGRQADGRLMPLRNESGHRMLLVLEGAQQARFPLDPGATATPHSFPIACGSAAELTVSAGIQRGDGTYNYGATTRVTLP